MTRAKIVITISGELLASIKAAGANGEAASVSAYISDAVQRRQGKRGLELLVEMLKAEHGEPTAHDYAWAEKQLAGMARPSD